MTETGFAIPYSMEKWRLAMLYFPGLQLATARHRLYVAIQQRPELVQKLQQTPLYRKGGNEFSRAQMELIFEYLGTPDVTFR